MAVALPSVTLCAAASVNVRATVAALTACLRQAEFADCLLFSDADIPLTGTKIRRVAIPRLNSSGDYSEFMLRHLARHIQTAHCLVVQWDGFILHADRWDPAFLEFDYIGAPWPQFDDGFDVGNGGFSLRSRRLLEACMDSRFQLEGPEDVAICRVNRPLLEQEHCVRFADRQTAEWFAFERTAPSAPTFGFHGVFNMMNTLSPDRFWDLYRTLDDRTTVFNDYWQIMGQINSVPRRLRLTADRAIALLGR